MRSRALAFAYRFSSGVRVSWASSTAFATLGTAVVTLLVLPLLDVLFDVLMGSDLSAPDLVRTGYAAALVALAVSVASGVVGTVATDRMLGVFQEVHTRRRLDVAYWLSVASCRRSWPPRPPSSRSASSSRSHRCTTLERWGVSSHWQRRPSCAGCSWGSWPPVSESTCPIPTWVPRSSPRSCRC